MNGVTKYILISCVLRGISSRRTYLSMYLVNAVVRKNSLHKAAKRRREWHVFFLKQFRRSRLFSVRFGLLETFFCYCCTFVQAFDSFSDRLQTETNVLSNDYI